MIKKLLMAAAVVAMAVPAAAQGSRRSEVSVSYGVAPVTDWIDSYSDMLTGLFTNANTDLKGWGAVTVGYSFRLIGSLRLGAQVVYSSNTQEVRGAGSEIRNRYWSLLPNVKYGKGAHSSQDAPLFVGGSPRRGVLTPSQALSRPSRSASCRRR